MRFPAWAFVSGAGVFGILAGYGISALIDLTGDMGAVRAATMAVGVVGTLLVALVVVALSTRLFLRAYWVRSAPGWVRRVEEWVGE